MRRIAKFVASTAEVIKEVKDHGNDDNAVKPGAALGPIQEDESKYIRQPANWFAAGLLYGHSGDTMDERYYLDRCTGGLMGHLDKIQDKLDEAYGYYEKE